MKPCKSTSANALRLALTLSLFFALPTQGAKKQSSARDEIQACVSHLSGKSEKRCLDLFYRDPQLATELLIADLKPARPGHYLSGKHPKSVWIVRALRSLTGLEFRAPMNAHLSANEAHFLGLDKRGTVKFFGTWMSRDSVWVAPEDAQIAIIRQWREWFTRNGQHYRYVNDRDVDDWYF